MVLGFYPEGQGVNALEIGVGEVVVQKGAQMGVV